MKVVAIYGGYGDDKEPAKKIMDIAVGTLKELQVEVDPMNLYEKNIPYYNHNTEPIMDELFGRIQEAEAVILGVSVQFPGIPATMQTFLDYGAHPSYRKILQGKYTLSIAISNAWGERQAGEQLLQIMNFLGAWDVDKIIGRLSTVEELNQPLREAVEKRIEDFYRIVRQKRKFLPSTSIPIEEEVVPKISQKALQTGNIQGPKQELPKEPINTIPPEKEESPPHYTDFTERQKADIEELAELFKLKTGKNEDDNPIMNSQQGIYSRPMGFGGVQPVKKTCRQMTANLPHYFQPHLATDFKGAFQLNISGKEQFQMTIEIDKQDCTCEEGVAQQPDIVIHADSQVWEDVLMGKVSVQKAFMIGQLKVRGNFMILGKIDQLFKKMA